MIVQMSCSNIFHPVCVSYLAAVQTLVENDSHRPHVHLVGDFGWFLPNHKALRGQIPDV